MRTLVVTATLFVFALPSAAAGSAEAPEIIDPVGDCQFAAGNHYADIVSGWISDETATDFLVNVQLEEWIGDQAGTFAGLTVQFTHQGIEWGVVAVRNVDAWEFSTGHVNTQTGDIEGYNATTGTFDAASATLTMLFAKSLFPHTMDDDKLTGIFAATADLKKDIPFFIISETSGQANPVPITLCDLAETTATYTFTLGQHTMRQAGASGANETAGQDDAVDGLAVEEGAPSPSPSAEPARGIPGPGLLAIVALGCFVASRRKK